jgi:hypothetical protein
VSIDLSTVAIAGQAPAPSRASLLVPHLCMAVAAMAIFAGLHLTVGRIIVGDGLGWDGAEYAAMLQRGWDRGGSNTALRPMIVWLAQPAYELTRNVVQAFDMTNYVYVGLLVFLLSRLMERYGASRLTSVVAILCISVSNAFVLAPYYPVTIDLGGHAMMTLALWQMIAGPRWAAAAASVVAVLSREYAPAVLIFGAIRDLRMRVPMAKTVATYLPAAIIYVLLRMAVIRSIGEGNSLRTFIDSLALWRDPMWAALYLYFAVTAIGGVSMIVAAQPRRWWTVIRHEPEWLGLAVPIALVTGVVAFDLWRYLLALTPLVLVLLARCSREWRPRDAVVFCSAMVVVTLVTQMPFQRMDVTRFFVDWFPYYAWIEKAPGGVTGAMLWPAWGWRFLGATLSLCALTMYANGRERTTVVTT